MGATRSWLRSDEVLHLKEDLAQLQAELDAAYDIISEMDDDDILEIQNQWLRDELKEFKEKSGWEDLGDVSHRKIGERQSDRHKRRRYRENVARGMHGQSLKDLALERRYGRQWDGSVIGELLRCCRAGAAQN
ncbi:uncharacterized protein LOC113565522 [Drosophila persimilis]|uniref:uncharacterized protein LOC113565522 n=1 Tax=Drosophila persimilis TaxID=7234 RepID=UPI000F075968|nr:uncharacterized protein LOC113565522 [Drosophila persimilis]